MPFPFRRALVTGANGFIGGALVLRLLAEGMPVRAVCRDPANGQYLTGAELVQGDVQNAERIRQLSVGCDLVFHVAAIGSGSAGIQHSVNVLGAENVARAAIAGGAMRLVHVSTVGVYGVQISGDVTEDSPFDPSPHDFYQQSKTLGEQSVTRITAEAELPTVIIRPAYVYGPRSQVWTLGMYELCRRLKMTPDIPGSAHPIFIDDLVDLLIAAAVHPRASGQVFNGSDLPVRWVEFLGAYARMAGIERTLSISPDALRRVYPFAHLINWATRLNGAPMDVTGLINYLSRPTAYKNDKARALLDWSPQTSLAEGMSISERWLMDQVRKVS